MILLAPHVLNLRKQRVFPGIVEGVPALPHAATPPIREPSAWKCQIWTGHTGVPTLTPHLQAECCSAPQRLSFLT